jgi:hypothetical protein
MLLIFSHQITTCACDLFSTFFKFSELTKRVRQRYRNVHFLVRWYSDFFFKRGVNSCPNLSTNLDKSVLTALVQSGVPAFLPASSTLSPQESLLR